MRRKASVICLVTIHGIGFQQPPQPGLPGYADALHQQLSHYLGASLLSDDPRRLRDHFGTNGPIYVQSCWPPGSNLREAGLARLGIWTGDNGCPLDITRAPLTNQQGSIAHIALVYSNLEGRGPRIGATLLSASMLTSSLARYAHLLDLTRMLFRDIQATLQHRQQQHLSHLRVRQDLLEQGKRCCNGLFQILRQLENDVAAYVCCDELRQRVRAFVADALLRLACRNDVSEIIVNAHSNGAVIVYDVLRQLPPFVTVKITTLITSGNPLRKYAVFFRWGREIANTYYMPSWLNFWDPHDPVADPLSPPLHWHRGTPIPDSQHRLFYSINPYTGATTGIDIDDIKVDNLRYSSGGGLQAHNYWQNETQFVQPLATLLIDAATKTDRLRQTEAATATYLPNRPTSPR